MTRLQHLAEYVPLRALATAMQCIEPSQNLRTASLIGSIFGRWGAARTERARSHICQAMPELLDHSQDAQQLAPVDRTTLFRGCEAQLHLFPRTIDPCQLSSAPIACISACDRRLPARLHRHGHAVALL